MNELFRKSDKCNLREEMSNVLPTKLILLYITILFFIFKYALILHSDWQNGVMWHNCFSHCSQPIGMKKLSYKNRCKLACHAHVWTLFTGHQQRFIQGLLHTHMTHSPPLGIAKLSAYLWIHNVNPQIHDNNGFNIKHKQYNNHIVQRVQNEL